MDVSGPSDPDWDVELLEETQRDVTAFPCFIDSDLGQVGDFISVHEPGLTVRLKVAPFPQYRTLFSLKFNVRFSEEDRPTQDLHHVSATLHLGSQHIDTILIEKVVLSGSTSVANTTVVPEFIAAGDPNCKERVGDGHYHKVTFRLIPAPIHAVGLLVNSTFGDQTIKMRDAKNIVVEAFHNGVLELYVRGQKAPDCIMEAYDLISAEKSTNILAPWYPKHPNKVFLQIGDYPAPEARPHIPLNAKPTFLNMDEYVTILGYAHISEHEYTKQSYDQLAEDISYLRVLTIPRAGDRQYFGFLELPEGTTARIEPGASMMIRFWEGETLDMLIWHAHATIPMPFSPHGHISILLNRPYDKEEEEWGRLTTELTPVDLHAMSNGDEVREALKAAEARPVKVKVVMSDAPFRRSLNGLRDLQDDSVFAPILLGNDLRRLRPCDIYDGLDVDNQDVIRAGSFNEDQQNALAALRHIPGGVAIIQGPPGTGKTHFLLHTLLALLPTDNQVMITSMSNTFVDDIARKADEMVKKKSMPGKFVVRVHTITTEEEIARLPAELCRPKTKARPPFLDSTTLDPNIEEMGIIKTASDFYASQTKRVHGIADRRVKLMNISLGFRMLQFAGLVDPHIEGINTAKYHKFVIHFEQYQQGEDLHDEMEAFNMQTRILRDDVLRYASVVVCTLYTAGATCVRVNVRPQIIAVDEASKIMEPELWPIFAWFAPNAFLLLGDQKQLKPVVMSSKKENPFFAQLSLSFFARMHLAGLMDTMFREQNRMCPELSLIVNRVFYNKQLVDGDQISSRHPTTTALEAWNKEKFGVASPLIFLDNPSGDAQRDALKSSYNINNVMVSLALVEDLLADEVLPGKEIVILTPYQAQWTLYLDYLDRLREKRPDLQVENVSAFKTDSFQGAEAPVVIVDLVVTTKAGFVGQANRLNVSLSRAKYGMYIVASMNILEERGVGKWITRVFGYLRKFQCYDKFRKMEFEEVSPESDSAWHPHPISATDPENPGSASPDSDWQPDPTSPQSASHLDPIPATDPENPDSSPDSAPHLDLTSATDGLFMMSPLRLL